MGNFGNSYLLFPSGDSSQIFMDDPWCRPASCDQVSKRIGPQIKFWLKGKVPNLAMHCHAWVNKPFAWVFALMTSAEFPMLEIPNLEFPSRVLLFPRSAAIIRHLESSIFLWNSPSSSANAVTVVRPD